MCQLLIFSLPVILFVTLVKLLKMLSSYDQLFCLLQLLYLWWTAVTGTVLPSLVMSLPNSSRRRNSRKPRCSSLPTNRYQIIFMVFFCRIIDKAKFLRFPNWFWIAFPSKYRSKNKIWSLNNMLSSLMFWNWCNTWYLWRWPLSFGSNTKNKDTLASR